MRTGVSLTAGRHLLRSDMVTGNSNLNFVEFTRMGNGNADLSDLAVSGGTLAPTFASATPSYSLAVENTIASLTVPPTWLPPPPP